MNIERLNKAASAAGFAMATPDDDETAVTAAPSRDAAPVQSQALVATVSPHRILSGEVFTGVTAWLKGMWPGMSGRQPA